MTAGSRADATQSRGAVVFSVSYIGDLILSTLTFDAVLERSGRPFEVVTAPAPAPLLAADPRVASVRIVRSSHPFGWRVEVARELLRARRRRVLVVNLEVYEPRWRFLRSLCRGTGTDSLVLDLPAFLEDERAAASGLPPSLPHRSWHYARAVGLENGAPPPCLFLSENAQASIADRLCALTGERVARIVVVHPGSSSPARRAPIALLAGTLLGIAERYEVVLIGVGSSAERPILESLRGHLGAAATFAGWAGELSILELAALLARADLFVGNDSGPLKIAEPVGARTLSFWGPSSSRFAGPRGRGHRMLEFTASVDQSISAACALLEESHAAGFRSTS